MQRIIVLSGLLLAVLSVNLIAVPLPSDSKPTEPPEPTQEQLAVAKETYAKHGAKYEPFGNTKTKNTRHQFTMPSTTTDADVNGLPDLPFGFSLSLYGDRQVTDAGLKEKPDTA